MKFSRLSLIVSSFAFSSAAILSSQTLAQPIAQLEFKDLKSPWGLEQLDDQTFLANSKHGKLYKIDLKSQTKTFINGVPKIQAYGQGGFLDIEKSPHFNKDNFLYFTYVKKSGDQLDTALARAKFTDNGLSDWQDLLVTISALDYDDVSQQHFGSRIAFEANENGQDYVFFSVGDRGHRSNGQDLQTHAGSIMRLHLDGSIPTDNPFINNDNALSEIYSYGHRNPQGLAFDQEHKNLWAIEHGPRGGDEVNLIKAKKNYGWPTISYGKEYYGPFKVGESTHKDGMEQPVKYYVPSIAPSSLLVHQGDLFAGALALTHVNHITMDGTEAVNEDRYFEKLDERIRDLELGNNGKIYMITDDGNLYSFALPTQ